MRTILRQLKLFLVVFLGYLTHVTIMPYISVNGVSPSMLLAVIALVVVGYGPLRGLWVGAFYGIVMEVMLPNVQMMNLLFYPVASLFVSLFFADKSAGRLQYERTVGKAARNRSPLLRTVLCAVMLVVAYETVNIVYMYLAGGVFNLSIFRRALTDVVLTTTITAVIMLPVRSFLGFRKVEDAAPAPLRFDTRHERPQA